MQSLLKQLARRAGSEVRGQGSEIGNCLCLVTTREPLTDLADFQRREGSPWGSVLRVDLGNLTDEAGAALLHHAGANRAGAAEIKSDDKELLAANREVDGHALTLNLLGRFLARAYDGDIRRRDLVKFEEADRKEQGGTTFKLLATFENWFANEGDIESRSLAVLRLLGLFDRPADSGCMAALRKPPVIAGMTEPLFTLKRDSTTGQTIEQPLTDKAWNDTTHFLADFGLIVIKADSDNSKRSLDCHPLIREHFVKIMAGEMREGWCIAHHRLFDHLQYSKEFQPESLEALLPLCQAITHGCKAGLQNDAFQNVYYPRINRGQGYLWRKFGAFDLTLQTLASFFQNDWWHTTGGLLGIAPDWLRNEAALCLIALGRLKEAIQPLRISLENAFDTNEWNEAAIRACNLSAVELETGEIAAAIETTEKAGKYADRSSVRARCLSVLAAQANALHQAGQFNQSFALFIATLEQNGAESLLPDQISEFQFCDVYLSPIERMAWHASILHRLPSPASGKKKSRHKCDDICSTVYKRAKISINATKGNAQSPALGFALDHLTAGRTKLYQAILKGSSITVCRRHLQQAVDGLVRSQNSDDIPRGLLSRAWLNVLGCEAENARADLDEAWDIAERGPMKLHMADIHLYRARLFFREKPYPWKSPQEDLAAAEKIIIECGYHRRDEELADAKSAILGAK